MKRRQSRIATQTKTKITIEWTMKGKVELIRTFSLTNQKSLRDAVNSLEDSEAIKLVEKYGDDNLRRAWGLTPEGKKQRQETKMYAKHLKSKSEQRKTQAIINQMVSDPGFMDMNQI